MESIIYNFSDFTASALPLFGAVIVGALAVFFLMWLMVRRPNQQGNDPDAPDRGIFGSLTNPLAKQLPESKAEAAEFKQLLKQAGIYQPSARSSIYALRFVLLFVPLVLTGILAIIEPPENTVQILVLGGVAAATLSIIPRLYVYFHRQSRLAEIRRGMADMMDMLSMCLGGGMPVNPSLEHVAKNLTNYPALAQELQILRRQAEIGNLKRALADFSERIDIPEARQVASMLARGEQLGVKLSRSLLDQADHFRSTRRELANMQANKTPVYLTLPLMFCFAPAVLIMLLSPAMLQLNEFFNPTNGENVLAGNETLSAERIVEFTNSLDQGGR
jgi:tight adherence protein C